MRVRGWACALWLTILLCAPAEGEVILHGFAQAGYSARITGAALPSGGGAVLVGEERLQLSLSGAIPAGVGGFSAKVDFFHDAVAGTTGLDIREAYLDVGGGKIGARVGRQIITWGTGDLLFINDVFPKDWTALFTGRPLEYLKIGSGAPKGSAQGGAAGLGASAGPFFLPPRLSLGSPRRNVYGGSGRGAALGGVVSLEAGYYDSREDRSGTDPLLPNSQALFLAGYQRQLSAGFPVGLQYYGERTLRYDRHLSTLPPGFPKQDELRQLVTARLTRLLKYQTWKLSLFGYWSPTEGDFYLIPEGWHRLADGGGFSAGATVFGGKSETSFFGQLDKNDNVYVTVRYEF